MVKLRVWIATNPQKNETVFLSVEIADVQERKPLLVEVTPLSPKDGERKIVSNLRKRSDSLKFEMPNSNKIVNDTLKAYHMVMSAVSDFEPIPAWLEACSEWVKTRQGWLFRKSYIGGKLSLQNDESCPFGDAGNTFEDVWAHLANKYSNIAKRLDVAKIAQFDLKGTRLSLDGHSAGIFVHEAIGHPAEVDNDIKDYKMPRSKGLEVLDVPSASWGMDYSISDEGLNGSEVLLLPCGKLLNNTSGNAFVGWNEKHAEMLIRQRNIYVRLSDTVQISTGADLPNAILIFGGISSKNRFLVLKAIINLNGQLRVATLNLPQGSVLMIQPNGYPRLTWASICIKKGFAHIFGLSVIGIDIEFSRPLSTYLI